MSPFNKSHLTPLAQASYDRNNTTEIHPDPESIFNGKEIKYMKIITAIAPFLSGETQLKTETLNQEYFYILLHADILLH